MARTFNCGIGMIAVVSPEMEERAMAALSTVEKHVHRIGAVTEWHESSGPRVRVDGLPFHAGA